jgi:hypothetical protein
LAFGSDAHYTAAGSVAATYGVAASRYSVLDHPLADPADPDYGGQG